MSTRSELAAAVAVRVGRVADPELRRPMSELGMVRSVQVSRQCDVVIDIALTTAVCPMVERIRSDVERAAHDVRDVRAVTVEFSTMTEGERVAAGSSVVSGTDDGSPAREIYAVASGKGGVGKSTVAANLAATLAAQGRAVGLIDADVWGYSVPQLFGVHRAPIVLGGKMLPVEAHGVRLMSLGFLVPDNEPVVWRGPMLHKALTQFVRDTHWGELDVLIVDLPPGTGDVTLSVLELLPEASLVAVTTPQQAAQLVASRVGAMAREVRMPVAGVVENMSEFVCSACAVGTPLFGAGGGAQLADQLQCELLGSVPLDIAARSCGDRGEPVVLAEPDAASSRALIAIAHRLQPTRRGLAGLQLGLAPISRAVARS